MMTRHEWDHSNTKFYTDADQMLDKEKLDGVMIGTRCSLHAKMAIKVLNRNISLFLEKPIATNMGDLLALRKSAETTKSEWSFPSLCASRSTARLPSRSSTREDRTVEQVQAWTMFPTASATTSLVS